jgi:hypothetical protein
VTSHYELFLRSTVPLSEEAVRGLEEAIAGSGPSGDGAASAPREGGAVVERYAGDGGLLGVDVSLSFEGLAGRLRPVLEHAASRRLAVYDPQLGRTVVATDAEEILEQARRSSAFHEGAPLGTGLGSTRSAPSTRIWLIVLGLVVAFFLLAKLLRCAI